MIRLRQRLERGIRHPVLGPLLLLLLVLLLAMTAFHESHETIAGHPGEFCVAFVGFLLGLLSLVVRIAIVTVVPAPIVARGPPEPPRVARVVGRPRPVLISLRL